MSCSSNQALHGQSAYMSEDEANDLIKKYDKNGDSILTKDELTAMILAQASQQHGPHKEIVIKHPKEPAKVPKQKDVVACNPKNKPAKAPEPKPFKIKLDRNQIREILLEHDIDGDDCLNMNELTKAFGTAGSMMPLYKAQYALQFADADGDGLISEDELEKLLDYAERVCNRK